MRNRYSRKSYSSRRRRSPRRRNFTPLVTFLFVVFLVVFLVSKLFGFIFTDEKSGFAFAQIQILKGMVEFRIPDEKEEWTQVSSKYKPFEGDSVRTAGNSKISLEFLNGNVLFLDGNSEIKIVELNEKSSGKKIVVLELLKGRMWAKVSDTDFNDSNNSIFEVNTNRTRTHVRGTIFDLTTTSNQDAIRLVKGNVDVDVFYEENNSTNIKVGVGQKLIVSSDSIEKIKNEEDVLEIIDNDFIESEWHLQNLEKFFPQEVSQIRRKIEISSPQKIIEPVIKESLELESPTILIPKADEHISANKDSAMIEGTAPLKAIQIVVNGYTLTRFQPGDRKWAYFASKKFGTLLPGENNIEVIAVYRDGQKSAPARVKFFYDGTNDIKNEATTPVIKSSIHEFKAPVITRPAVIDYNEPYQTSAEVVTITGIVDPKTNRIEVNGFVLQKFKPGETGFRYTANAKTGYGNMKVGENVYEIIAFGPDGKKASTTIKIIYTPVNVPVSTRR